MSGNKDIIELSHPGAHPAIVSTDPVDCKCEEAKHIAKVKEYKTCTGVMQVLKDEIG